MAIWKLEDAKNQFSRVVRAAKRYGPQVVTRHGREEVVVPAIEDYRKLARRQEGLVAFVRRSPLTRRSRPGSWASSLRTATGLFPERTVCLPRPECMA